MLKSLIAEFVETQPAARLALELYAHDLVPFEMDLLKPERTFVEKLLALHVSMSSANDESIAQVRTRHYYDVAQLFARSDDVRASIASGGFRALLEEAAAVSNRYFAANIDIPTLDLRSSPALNPTSDQVRVLRASYDTERALYYRDFVPFDDIIEQVRAIREAL